MTLLLVLLAAAAPAPAPGAAPTESGEWSAPRIVNQGCRRSGDEIVVCGRRDTDRYRLRDLGPDADRDARKPPIAMALGDGVRAEVEALQLQRPDGLVDKRVMVHFKFKF
jgi:hypothetical protein